MTKAEENQDGPGESRFPMELQYLEAGFPAGIYEIATEGVSYELKIDPGLGYLGTLIVDRNPGLADFDGEERGKELSIVAVDAELGEQASFTTQDQDLNLRVRKTAKVTAIQLLRLL